MTAKEQHEADMKRVEDAVAALGDHFDTVQVFVTRHEAGMVDGTVTISKGAGNWFARFGQVVSWTTVMKEHDRLRARNEHNHE